VGLFADRTRRAAATQAGTGIRRKKTMMPRNGARVASLCLLARGAAGAAPALAQEAGRLEVGAQVTAVRLSELETTDVGVGVQAGWRLGPVLKVDGALSWFPGDDGDESP
jgi:hypothetical protein